MVNSYFVTGTPPKLLLISVIQLHAACYTVQLWLFVIITLLHDKT